MEDLRRAPLLLPALVAGTERKVPLPAVRVQVPVLRANSAPGAAVVEDAARTEDSRSGF